VDTEACEEHQEQWQKYRQEHSYQTIAGVRRILQHRREQMPWQATLATNDQPHDQPAEERQ